MLYETSVHLFVCTPVTSLKTPALLNLGGATCLTVMALLSDMPATYLPLIHLQFTQEIAIVLKIEVSSANKLHGLLTLQPTYIQASGFLIKHTP